ncbi:hypothetical protein B9Z19DRAFT_1085572 [Tuber borchii]|uniref:Rhodopsin domain-containing protein n=1 Tax=Tuber borchii TaxID=42251 RepID=A0A2T6ZQI0_TUBBO|nr:hypothetical protein B9Z19DRAFT_1085572 [Tuber borchii]
MFSKLQEPGEDLVVPGEGPWGSTTATILLSVAGAVVIARMYSRGIIMRFVGGDDYCILCAMATAIALTVLLCKSAEYGAGRHISDIPKDDILRLIKMGYSMQILYVVVMTFTKASLLLLLLRLVKNRRMLVVVWPIFGFMCTFAMVSFWASVFHCTPPPYVWKGVDRAGTHKVSCGNFKALQYWVPAGSILTDIILWLLPLRLIYPLRLPRAQKIVLYMVFILGAMVFISASVRISLILALGTFGPHPEDPTWTTYQINLWSIVEATIAITCSSLPTLRPLVNKHFPFVFSLLSKVFDKPDRACDQNSFRIPTSIMETDAQPPSKLASPPHSASNPGLISTGLSPDSNISSGDPDIDLEAGIGSSDGKESRSTVLEMDIADMRLNPGSETLGSIEISRPDSGSSSNPRSL